METDQKLLARAREDFLANGHVDPRVRSATINAWRRSKAAGVAPNGAPPLAATRDFDRDSSLLRAVEPVTTDLMRQFPSSDVAMVVADRDAKIVGRWASGSPSRHRFEAMGVQLGQIFDEARVGSTALGTVLETGETAVIEGAEHWNDCFDAVTAAGAPIIHPGTGVVEGVIDIVCSTGVPVSLMLPLVCTAARQAGERLLNGYAREDRELLDAFLQSDRRGPRRPVIAINGRMMMANSRAGALLGGQNPTLEWEQVERAIVDGRELITLDDGRGEGPALEGRLREVRSDGGRLGALIQVVVADAAKTGVTWHPVPTSGRTRAATAGASTPSLGDRVRRAAPGRSLRWTAAVDACTSAIGPGGRLLIVGPKGAGRSHLATALAEQSGLQYGMASESALPTPADAPDLVLIELTYPLESSASARIERWLDALSAERPASAVVATLRREAEDSPHSVEGSFDDVVDLPPLGQRISDLEVLVGEWTRQRGVAVDPSATRALSARTWPGNVAQLYRCLDTAVARGGGRRIQPADLPAAPTVNSTRRGLSYLENAERDALAALLAASGGNKLEVARELGIARSTLYRKLAALGLND